MFSEGGKKGVKMARSSTGRSKGRDSQDLNKRFIASFADCESNYHWFKPLRLLQLLSRIL
jgi:hypothetical protein